MSRPLRLEIAGGLYHVTSRGDRREDIYHDDNDRLAWLALLDLTCERYNWQIHAWCQMSNHYHLIVETVEGNLSAGMRQLNGVYTQSVNRRYRRSGHVFQGRYKAILVERDSYLLELSRYVVLNPVRAATLIPNLPTRKCRARSGVHWRNHSPITSKNSTTPSKAWLRPMRLATTRFRLLLMHLASTTRRSAARSMQNKCYVARHRV